jgi:hypothetical protein
LDAKDTLDGGGTESLGDLELDERDDRDLVLAKSIIRRRRRHADRFAEACEQLERDPGAIADLLERLGREVERTARSWVRRGSRATTHPVGWH